MTMPRFVSVAVVLLALGLPRTGEASFTETLPQGAFMLDVAFNYSLLSNNWDSDGNLAPLIASIERYEPGGGKQGTLIPNADVNYSVLVMQLQYGILDWLSVAVGLPLVLNTVVDPSFAWESGDYQPQLGRPYSQSDFWEWAGSMGQPKPARWQGNQGVPSDLVLGFRMRFSDWFPVFERAGVGMALSVMGALPTGRQADADEVVSVGTTLWDLQSQGDLAVHLGLDKRLGSRLVLGLEFHYDTFFPRTMTTPTGRKNPLLLNEAPYVGKTYELDPGDYFGFSVAADVVVWKGPARGSWITGGDLQKAQAFPPLMTLSLAYTFNANGQSDFNSLSDLWDHKKEEQWKAGYRNILKATVLFSFLRVGAPVQLYVGYRTMQLIPGKNGRAGQVFVSGIRIPFTF